VQDLNAHYEKVFAERHQYHTVMGLSHTAEVFSTSDNGTRIFRPIVDSVAIDGAGCELTVPSDSVRCCSIARCVSRVQVPVLTLWHVLLLVQQPTKGFVGIPQKLYCSLFNNTGQPFVYTSPRGRHHGGGNLAATALLDTLGRIPPEQRAPTLHIQVGKLSTCSIS